MALEHNREDQEKSEFAAQKYQEIIEQKMQ